jgi:hypothetical protein
LKDLEYVCLPNYKNIKQLNMKKIYLTLGLGVLFLGANAQQFKNTQQSKLGKAHIKNALVTNRLGNSASTYSVTIDTLTPASIMTGGCGAVSGGVVYYLAHSTPDSGYAFGTSTPNTFTYNIGTVVTITATTTELAQRYSVGTASATVTNVLVWPGVGSGSVTTTQSNIYSETTYTPGTMLGSSGTVPMSAYATAVASGGFVNYTYSTPVTIAASSNFYASVTIPAMGGSDKDTMAVLTTTVGCSSALADSLSWLSTTYQIPGVGNQVQWSSVKQSFGAANNLDIMIFPVIDITSSAAGINNYVSHGGLSLYAAYPNPTNSTVNINFSLNTASKVDVEVYDVTGKIVKTISNNNLAAGANSITIDASTLEAGSYIYCVNANGNRMFSKFMVTK